MPDVDLPHSPYTIPNRPRQCPAPCRSTTDFHSLEEKFLPRPQILELLYPAQ